MGEDECFITVHICSSTSICSLPQKQCLKQFPPLPLSPPNSLCHPGWPWTPSTLNSGLCLGLTSTSASSAKKHALHSLLLLSYCRYVQTFAICLPHSLLWVRGRDEAHSRPKASGKRGWAHETHSYWTTKSAVHVSCMQRGRVQSACPNAKCNGKHKQHHACLPGVVVLLKSPDFNKLDKKYDIDEQQLFIYFKTAVERSWNVLNANDKYLRY